MNRTFLMALLALDLLVLACSGFIMWDRVQKNRTPPQTLVSPVVAARQAVEARVEASTPTSVSTVPAALAPEPVSAASAEAAAVEKPRPAGNPRKILFRYHDSIPERVSIAGEFNEWSPQLLNKDENDNWTAVLRIPPGEYAYNFIVDGKMIRDPANKKVKNAGQKIASSLLVVKPKP